MISIQVDINKDQIEDALVDHASWADDDFISMVRSVLERIGDPSLVKRLIGELGDTYTYLEGIFGDGAE